MRPSRASIGWIATVLLTAVGCLLLVSHRVGRSRPADPFDDHDVIQELLDLVTDGVADAWRTRPGPRSVTVRETAVPKGAGRTISFTPSWDDVEDPMRFTEAILDAFTRARVRIEGTQAEVFEGVSRSLLTIWGATVVFRDVFWQIDMKPLSVLLDPAEVGSDRLRISVRRY